MYRYKAEYKVSLVSESGEKLEVANLSHGATARIGGMLQQAVQKYPLELNGVTYNKVEVDPLLDLSQGCRRENYENLVKYIKSIQNEPYLNENDPTTYTLNYVLLGWIYEVIEPSVNNGMSTRFDIGKGHEALIENNCSNNAIWFQRYDYTWGGQAVYKTNFDIDTKPYVTCILASQDNIPDIKEKITKEIISLLEKQYHRYHDDATEPFWKPYEAPNGMEIS